ncbi:MAG: zinc ribbon domain-containing protein [Candidatus Bathyarchaeia archaeon]|jgi:ribosomal protein L40E
MLRDTFEANPGLHELFKRKILERARFVGLSETVIDFDSHLDKTLTYTENLRIFYRKYPRLTQGSDYFRIKSIRPLSGAALEWSWRNYERNNGHEVRELTKRTPIEQPLTTDAIMPELVITYTIDHLPSTIPSCAGRFCSHCGNPTKPRTLFCSKCGKPLSQTNPAPPSTIPILTGGVCMNCGNTMKPGDRFCRKCGTALQATPLRKGPLLGGHSDAAPSSELRFCAKCGTRIVPDDSFCRKCGARKQ